MNVRAEGSGREGGHIGLPKGEALPDKDTPLRPWASPEGNGPTHITVEWAMPPASLVPYEYELQYGGRLLGKWITVPPGMEEDPKSEVRRIGSLKPNEKYIVRVRARFSYGEAFGPWSAKSSPIRTLAEGAAVSATDGAGGGGFSSIAASRAHEKEFEGVGQMQLKAQYAALWKHKVAGHRGDPSASSKSYSLPVVIVVNERGFHMAMKATSTIKATFDMESIKKFRTKGSSTFLMTVGMLNSANAAMQMWAHGMDTHRGEQPYHFEYEFETKEGKLIGAAILRAAQQAEEAEQDKMRSLMSASNFAKPSVEPSAFMR